MGLAAIPFVLVGAAGTGIILANNGPSHSTSVYQVPSRQPYNNPQSLIHNITSNVEYFKETVSPNEMQKLRNLQFTEEAIKKVEQCFRTEQSFFSKFRFNIESGIGTCLLIEGQAKNMGNGCVAVDFVRIKSAGTLLIDGPYPNEIVIIEQALLSKVEETRRSIGYS